MTSRTSDQITYLNQGNEPPFFSKLIHTVTEMKQARAPAAQWLASIKALTQKGVKQLEIEEADFTHWLASQGSTVIDKERLLQEIARRYYTIKEVVLSVPKFHHHRQAGGQYREILYIANAEIDNVQDQLEELDWKLEEYSFYPERIAEDPAGVIALEQQRADLMTYKGKALDFPNHHYSSVVNGRLGKNLLAHCRVSVRGDIYFIEEIQSDWAQRGRADGWRNISRGPLVTNTEAWAGMVLRRQMQIAARMPGIKQVAWITESMRNGGLQNLVHEQTKVAQMAAFNAFVEQCLPTGREEVLRDWTARGAATDTEEAKQAIEQQALATARNRAQRAGIQEPLDMLNAFYVKIMPKLAEKAFGKTGVKVKNLELDLAASTPGQPANVVKVPGFEMTDELREVLKGNQPMYSRAPLLGDPRRPPLALTQAEFEQAVVRAHQSVRTMFGSASHLRLASHVYDIATGREVAGRYINKLIQVSLKAHDIEEVADHEAFHFAEDVLLTSQEKFLIKQEFAPDTELNFRVRTTLTRRGMFEAAQQCSDPSEAAAHAFALWKRGALSVTERPVETLFGRVVKVLKDCEAWFKQVVLREKVTTTEELFTALASGDLARERLAQQEARQGDSSIDERSPGNASDEVRPVALTEQ